MTSLKMHAEGHLPASGNVAEDFHPKQRSSNVPCAKLQLKTHQIKTENVKTSPH